MNMTIKVERESLQKNRFGFITGADKPLVKLTINGQWSMVNGQWSMVNGQWSMVNGQWSMVNDQ
jgi:plasmid maintenance system killer protein